MDWKNLIAELQAAGHTQVEIARFCGCEQTTISALARGVTTDPKHTTGDRLLSLLRQVRKAKPSIQKAEA